MRQRNQPRVYLHPLQYRPQRNAHLNSASTVLSSRLHVVGIELSSVHLVDTLVRDCSVLLSSGLVTANRVDEAVDVATNRLARAVNLTDDICLWSV